MDLNQYIIYINDIVWGWPLILFVLGMSVYVTLALAGVQFTFFAKSWKLLFSSANQEKEETADMTSFQSFLNALSASVGNGSIAGMSTALYAGGPGAAFWVFVFGILSMSVRFAEVFLSTYFIDSALGKSLGGPMIYLKNVPGRKFLPYIFALFCFFFGLTSGNAMQSNSIRIGLVRILNLNPWLIATVLFLFMVYVMSGGAERIVKVSDAIVPIKVGIFFLTVFIILIYHFRELPHAFYLIYQGAFEPGALYGGVIGYSIQQAMRFGIVRSITATEVGLGTAAVLFGGSGSKKPVESGLISMLSGFISSNFVCFAVALLLLSSGVWNNGQTSIDLTISAYETVFGVFGGWIVTFLSVAFGLGVLVAYAYIARACWIFLTNGKYLNIYMFIFCAMTFVGAVAKVEIVWNSIDLVNAGLLIANLYAIMWLMPIIRRQLKKYSAKHS